MPSKALKSVKKFKAIKSPSTMDAKVSKSATLMNSVLEVASTGPDDSRHFDKELTPGPASRSLSAKYSYALVWTVGFQVKGSSTLTVVITPVGSIKGQTIVRKVEGEKGDVLSRTILVP